MSALCQKRTSAVLFDHLVGVASSACRTVVSAEQWRICLPQRGAENDLHGERLPRCSRVIPDGRSRSYHRDEGRHSYWSDGELFQFCIVITTTCPFQHRADL